MFQRQYFIDIIIIASCLALVAQANEDVKLSTTSPSSGSSAAPSSKIIISTGNNNGNVPAPPPPPTTNGPSGAGAAAASAIATAMGANKGPLILPSGGELPATTGPPPGLGNGLQERLASAKLPAAAIEAVKDHLAQAAKGEGQLQSVSIQAGKPPAATGEPSAGDPVKPEERLAQYFEQVCGAVNKLSQKQLFKLQSQLKQFVERFNNYNNIQRIHSLIISKTAGKMSLCFMTHYNIDPNLAAATVENLSTICSSRSLPAEAKGSFKQFQACSRSNWDVNLDKELERIIAARKNHAMTHDHIKEKESNSSFSSLTHDDQEDDNGDELAMIGDVVKKVLAGNKDVANKPGINVIDVSGPAVTAAIKNKLAPHQGSDAAKSSGTTASPLASLLAPNKKDSNTVVVFVDDSTNNNTTKQAADMISTTSKPASLDLETHSDVKIKLNLTSSAADTTTTTIAPDQFKLTLSGGEQNHPQEAGSSIEQRSNVTLSALVKAALDANTTTSPIPAPSSAGPTVATDSTTSKPAATDVTVIKVIGGADKATTGRPKQAETLQEMLKRQEKEKADLEAKLKVEREMVMKQLQKKQDETDAKNAIKSLQLQRATGGHAAGHADAQLHQWEHERQMSIDPVGHTIKHQQYEINKQKKTMSIQSIRRLVQ